MKVATTLVLVQQCVDACRNVRMVVVDVWANHFLTPSIAGPERIAQVSRWGRNNQHLAESSAVIKTTWK